MPRLRRSGEAVSNFYAGIGSRRTPPDMLKLMERIAARLADDGWILRSGHAPGADQAFERGADGRSQLFLPWPGFQSDAPEIAAEVWDRPRAEAYDIAAKYHPAWHHCSQGARSLHARNVHQILGYDLDEPVSFVVCWSDGRGGTEQALRVARDRDIPISNLRDSALAVDSWLGEDA